MLNRFYPSCYQTIISLVELGHSLVTETTKTCNTSVWHVGTEWSQHMTNMLMAKISNTTSPFGEHLTAMHHGKKQEHKKYMYIQNKVQDFISHAHWYNKSIVLFLVNSSLCCSIQYLSLWRGKLICSLWEVGGPVVVYLDWIVEDCSWWRLVVNVLFKKLVE